MLYNRIKKEKSKNVAEIFVIKICEPDLTGTSLISRFFENFVIV